MSWEQTKTHYLFPKGNWIRKGIWVLMARKILNKLIKKHLEEMYQGLKIRKVIVNINLPRVFSKTRLKRVGKLWTSIFNKETAQKWSQIVWIRTKRLHFIDLKTDLLNLKIVINLLVLSSKKVIHKLVATKIVNGQQNRSFLLNSSKIPTWLFQKSPKRLNVPMILFSIAKLIWGSGRDYKKQEQFVSSINIKIFRKNHTSQRKKLK